jgi:hypothetical protein
MRISFPRRRIPIFEKAEPQISSQKVCPPRLAAKGCKPEELSIEIKGEIQVSDREGNVIKAGYHGVF